MASDRPWPPSPRHYRPTRRDRLKLAIVNPALGLWVLVCLTASILAVVAS